MKKYLLSFAALMLCATAYAALPAFSPAINIGAIRAAAPKLAAPAPHPVAARAQPVSTYRGWDYSSPAVTLDEWNVGERQYLPYCRGYVRLELKNGRAYVIFNHVERCSEYEVRSNDGYRAIDREKFLNGTWTYGGSYTIPNGLTLLGENSISLVLHAAGDMPARGAAARTRFEKTFSASASAAGRRAPYDVVRVNFWAW